MAADDSSHPLQRLHQAPLSRRLSELTGGGVSAPADLGKAVARLRPPPARRGVVFALIDVSVSMTGAPLEQAKLGFVKFAAEAAGLGYEVGLASFGDTAALIHEPTDRILPLRRAVEKLASSGGTDMAAAIILAAARLRRAAPDRVIFLVTDGAPNDREATLKAAVAAKADGMAIITLGTEGADHVFLRQIASRDQLARSVAVADLQLGMCAAAKLLLER